MKPAKNLIAQELRKDKKLRLVHLQDAILSLLKGDKRIALLMMRDIVNATCGFPKLSRDIGLPDKSLQRMLSIRGNPESDNLFKIIDYLLHQEGVEDISIKLKSA